jgi:hypothetical protein
VRIKTKQTRVAAKRAVKKMGVRKKGTMKYIGKKVARKGNESWLVTSGGRVKVITTRRTATAAMDEAVKLYSGALKRLANR